VTLTGNLQGALWILAGCVAGTVFSLSIKALAGAVHSLEITFIRCAIGLVLILPMIHRAGGFRATLGAGRWKLQVFRGLLAVVAINCGFYTLTALPLTTATTLFFTAPLFVTLLAPLILKEVVGWRRYSATAVGFAGVLIVMRPGGAGFDPAMLIAVLSSLFFSVSLILNKILSETDTPTTTMTYFTLVTVIAGFPPATTVWVWPDQTAWLLLIVIAVFAQARTYFDIKGYAAGEASFVAPFQYMRILFITVTAYLFFGEVPDAPTVAGAAVIVASTLYIAQREALRKSSKPGVAAP
jgi:drug/metabolite transporter (DMT)-like permease